MCCQLVWLLRRVRALAAWRMNYSIVRIYARSLRRLYRRVVSSKRAALIQATARMRGPRLTFKKHAAALFAARDAKALAEKETYAVISVQAVLRGNLSRLQFRREQAAIAEIKNKCSSATLLQSLFRGMQGRRECARRLQALLEVLIPQVERLQRWWRVVLSEKLLRKVRSVVDRYTDGHKALMRELSAMRTTYASLAAAATELSDAERFLRASFQNRSRNAEVPHKSSGGRRFELWVSLKVGFPPETAGVLPAFAGHQIFSARSAVLRRAGIYFKDFFSDPTNAEKRDEDGHFRVQRSWKHFDAILDYIRDGSCALPKAYVPSTYDNRPASSEEQELLEFLREAHFYGLEPLVDLVIPKVISLKYGENPQLLQLLRKRGII
mmetsp:Transcript_39822/g.66038  ORF Transcript_39822/g.66038 Transcript_39822/m.66038 type:complete len:382 (+) Transcript_39822:1642-2787(+)